MYKTRLTSKRPLDGIDEFIFPDDIFEIPGLDNISNTEVIDAYTRECLQRYAGDSLELYLNGGLTVEVVSVIYNAYLLGISLKIFHLDRNSGYFKEQPLRFKPSKAGTEEIKIALCKNRHEGLPDQAVFDSLDNDQFFDFKWQEEQAENALACLNKDSQIELTVYVTGLTMLLISLLNVASDMRIPVKLMHYNIQTESYFQQKIDV